MPAFRTSPLLSLTLLAALAAGCASGGQGNSPAPATQSGASTVTADELARTPHQHPEQALQGRFAGVHVTHAPDGGLLIRIRGGSSIHGNNEPLYVVDGVPVTTGPGGSLTGFSVNDIASIQVLKDAASTSMYGVRGANGVILIKTKRAQ